MTEIDKQTTEIRQAALTYEAAQDVNEWLREVTLVPLIGVFAVGKTAIMEAATTIDVDFGRVRSFTTREQRPGESADTYDFLPHNEKTLASLLKQINRRELVQFAVHPTTGHIYGSRPEDYSKPYAMLDTMPTSLPNLYPLPFKGIQKIAVVTSPEQWLTRLEGRLATTAPEDINKRLAEGVMSLEWCLAQTSDLAWLHNGEKSLVDVAHEFISLVKEEKQGEDSASREYSRLLLGALRNLVSERRAKQ